MDHDTHTKKRAFTALHSKGGRLYVKPTDILASEPAQRTLARFKKSSIYEAIQARKSNPSSAA